MLEWLKQTDELTVEVAGRRKLVLQPGPDERERLESSLSSTRRKMLRLADRDGSHCVWCLTPLTYQSLHATIDHIRCRSHDGTDALDNLVLACASCNHRRADQSALIYLEGRLRVGSNVDIDSVLAAIARSDLHHAQPGVLPLAA
jgi:hypothetical protein